MSDETEGWNFAVQGRSPAADERLMEFPVIFRGIGGEYLQCFFGHADNYRGPTHKRLFIFFGGEGGLLIQG